jgi:hypothetical protein
MKILKNIFSFYYNWFKNLSKDSKKLWILIIVKSTIILIVLLIFFPDILWQFKTDEEKASFVEKNLLQWN